MINAGILRVTWALVTPAEACSTSQLNARRIRRWGNVVVFSQWGRVAGWSELADSQHLPWLTGMLSLAWVYRLGHTLFSHRIALTTMLLLSTSVIFLTYMIQAQDLTGLPCSSRPLSFGPTGALPCTHGQPGRGARALPGAGRDRPALYQLFLRAAAARAGALPSVLRAQGAAAGGSRCYCSDWPHCSPCHKCLIFSVALKHNQEKDHLHAEALRYPEVIATFLRLSEQWPASKSGAFQHAVRFSPCPCRSCLPCKAAVGAVASHPERPGTFCSPAFMLLLLLLGASEWLRVIRRETCSLPGNVVATFPVVNQPGFHATLARQPAPGSRSGAGRSGGPRRSERLSATRGSWSASQGSGVRQSIGSIAATRAIAAEGSDSGLLAVDRSGLFARFQPCL